MVDAGSHRRSVERGLQRAFVALVVLFLFDWCATLFATPVLHRSVVLVASAVQVLDWVVLCVRGWRSRLGPVDAVRACVVAAVVLVALAFAGASVVAPATRIQFVVIPVVLSALVLSLALAVSVALLPVAAYLVGAVPVEGWMAVGELWPVLSAVAAAGAAAPTLRAAASAAEDAQNRLQRLRAHEVVAASRWTAHREFQRLLHDHVTAALHTIAAGLSTGEESRREAGLGAEALRAEHPSPGGESVDVGAMLRRAAGVAGTPVEFDLGAAVTAPAEVAQAVALAVEEALRNVDRHARATKVVLSLASLRGGFAVSVVDDGVGRQGRDRAGAVGLRRSIIQRVADVGGSAVVTGVREAGTTVTLRWTSAEDREPDRTRVLALAVGDIRKPLAAVVVAYLVGNGIMAALNVGSSPNWVWLVAWGSVLAVVTLLLLSRADRPMSGRGAVLVLSGLLAFMWIGLVLMPADSLSGYESWPVGAVGPALMVLAVVLPPWQVFLFCVLEMVSVGVLIALSVLDPQPWITLVPVALAPVFLTAMGAVFAFMARRYGRVVARSRAEEFAVLAVQSRRAARETLRRQRADALASEFAPFLEAVANGELAFDAPATRARAAELEQASRDELHLPGVLDAETKTVLARAREHGCVVDFHTDTDSMVVPRQVTTLVRAALTGDCPDHLIVSLYRSPAGVLVSLVAVPGDADRLRAELRDLPVRVEDDHDAVSVELTV